MDDAIVFNSVFNEVHKVIIKRFLETAGIDVQSIGEKITLMLSAFGEGMTLTSAIVTLVDCRISNIVEV